jgi:YYY domain-containing protein
MLPKRTWVLLLVVLGLRLVLQGWDWQTSSSSPHPDERQVGYVSERATTWFADPGFYAYGSLHFQAVRATTGVLFLGGGSRGLIVGGRTLSLVASMLAIILAWFLAHRVWGRRTGELFLMLVAWIPLDLQQSHFATVEGHHAVWVMAALAACFWLTFRCDNPSAAATGAAIGASLAVKVSSLALVVPLAVALVIVMRRRGLLEAIRLCAVAISVGVAVFWFCQPWAFTGGRFPFAVLGPMVVLAVLLQIARSQKGVPRLALFGVGVFAAMVTAEQLARFMGVGGEGAAALFSVALNPDYLRGVGEQVAMVMGEADLPYVRVYNGTLPVLYPLRELAFWGLGPLLLAAVLIGSGAGVTTVLKRWRRWLAMSWTPGFTLLLILLAWLIPMTVRLSTLQVKYLRYWEPLVVPGTLVAAWWLVRMRQRHRRFVVAAVIAGTVLWGLGYVWAFIEPHPHRTAARWLSPLIDTDQVVAYEHWDETLDLRPPGGPVERIDLPSYNLPDHSDKSLLWCGQLARADWIVLTSNRVRRTVLANPERFPITGRLYRLLLSGEAGFTPVARVDRGPRILGLFAPVQQADESFVNYDFPRVLIFRRTGDVLPEELTERVQRPLPYLEDLDFKALEARFVEPLPSINPVPSGFRQFWDLVIWTVVFGALCLATWAIFLTTLRRLPDAGIGLALATGWIVPSWVMWFGSELGLWSTGATTASWIFLVIIAAGGLGLSIRWREAETILRQRQNVISKVVAVVVVVGLLFLVVRLFNPAIHWGEKPMDFSFLNSFVQSASWPPGEPWMAGMSLHYYYFGEVLAAFPILVAGCSAGVGYNLMSASIPALSAAVLAGFGLLLTRRWRWFAACVLPLLVLISGNFEWLWELDLARAGRWFDMWWATSRVIPGFAIDEYPLWTAIFADLHGHFIALPVVLAVLGWGWLCADEQRKHWLPAAVVCGLCVAALVATNPWDLFILTATLGLGTIAISTRPEIGLGRLTAAAVVSLAAAAPFIVELVVGINAGAGGGRGLFFTDADFAPWWVLFRHFGLFLTPLVVLAVTLIGRSLWTVILAAGIGAIAGLSFGSEAAAAALAVTALLLVVARRTPDRLMRLGWSLAALGTTAIAFCERFTLIDRMNTVFKIYNGAWLLMAIALATMLLRVSGWRRRLLIAVWIPLQAVALVNLPLGIAQGWLQPRMSSPRPTLDGQAFLAAKAPETWFLVRALQGAAEPRDAVAEAAGISYSRYTRIAMHTGQPTVVGWDWHLKQRGQSDAEIRARFADLETLYAGVNPRDRRAVLDRYQVAWVVLAAVERQSYSLTGPDPMAGVPGLLRFAELDGAVLYRVLPNTTFTAAPVQTTVELPAGVEVVGRIPERSAEVVRSLALDESGATAILLDGSMVDLDVVAQEVAVLDPPGCTPLTAVARRGAQRWAACGDGGLWHRVGAGTAWTSVGRIPGVEHVSVADEVWAWGEAGLWKYQGGTRWEQTFSGAVSAAAARGPGAAWSDGRSVWVGRNGSQLLVKGDLDDIRALAWQGPVLWALDGTGLHKSAGAVMRWRRGFEGLESVIAVEGSLTRLWLVLDDGVILEIASVACTSPWQSSDGVSLRGLDEPRGLGVSPDGWFVVADTQHHRLRWYSAQGLCMDTEGAEGSGPGEFLEPSGLALAADGTLAVADTWNGRVQLLLPDGTTEVLKNDFYGPRGLLWEPDGSLVVADTGNRRLMRCRPPKWQPESLAVLSGPVVGLAWAGGLMAVAVPSEGVIALVNPTDGSVVRTLDVPGWSGGDQQEGYLAMLPSGLLAASAPTPGEIWLIDPAGVESPQLLRGGLEGVTALALLPDGRLLASQTWNNRLVKIAIGP